MDYSKIRLGLWGKLMVLREIIKTEIDKNKKYGYGSIFIDIDYSTSNKLEEYLLEQKRVRKATKDALKLYKKVREKLPKGVFIEEYLIKNGLKPKKVSEKESSIKNNFIEKYSVESREIIQSEDILNPEEENVRE